MDVPIAATRQLQHPSHLKDTETGVRQLNTQATPALHIFSIFISFSKNK